MRHVLPAALGLLAATVAAGACGGGKLAGAPGDGGAGGSSGGGSGASSSGGSTAEGGVRPPSAPATKLDLLFVLENTKGMLGVTFANDFLSASVQPLIDRLLNPNCVDASGNVLGPSQNGQCTSGKLEFQPVHDMHVGVLTTSLGGQGGDQCPDDAENPANANLSAHTDDHGELIGRGGVQGNPDTVENTVTDATAPDDFLAWLPPVAANTGAPAPPVVAIGSETQLVGDVQALFLGAGVHGCGFRAPLDVLYRFLAQPDPYDQIGVTHGIASYSGVDATILKQRHDFLRPDSAVAIVTIVTKNDQAFDSLAIGGQGWAFANTAFPGSPNMGAPEGSIQCQTAPESSACTSCAFLQGSPSFATECPNDPPGGTGGYLDPSDDALNVRPFHMKQRFGVDAQFPIARYITGLTSYTVPDSAHEHDASGNYAPVANCDNPLFSTNLPTDASADLCHLAPGPRQPNQVFFTVIGGVPHQLLQVDPTNPDSPQKTTLGASDWTIVLGNDPLHYDFSGADYHMIESTQERTSTDTDPSKPAWGTDPITMSSQSSCPDTSADDCDPINGREFATNKSDLEFACIYPFATQLDCTSPGPGDAYAGACQCATGGLEANSQLCQKSNGSYTQLQINGFAQPSVRQLSVARSLGAQAVVGSLCPIHTTEATPGDPLYAFRPPLSALVDRLSTALAK
jgi:hypothetical protein